MRILCVLVLLNINFAFGHFDTIVSWDRITLNPTVLRVINVENELEFYKANTINSGLFGTRDPDKVFDIEKRLQSHPQDSDDSYIAWCRSVMVLNPELFKQELDEIKILAFKEKMQKANLGDIFFETKKSVLYLTNCTEEELPDVQVLNIITLSRPHYTSWERMVDRTHKLFPDGLFHKFTIPEAWFMLHTSTSIPGFFSRIFSLYEDEKKFVKNCMVGAMAALLNTPYADDSTIESLWKKDQSLERSVISEVIRGY